jgi:hypothetical protein
MRYSAFFKIRLAGVAHILKQDSPAYRTLWNLTASFGTIRGVYTVLENPPPPRGGKNISRCNLGEKIWKGEEKKGKNVKEKGRKGKE